MRGLRPGLACPMRPLVSAVTGLVALTTILTGSLATPAQSSQPPRSDARGAGPAAPAGISATTVPSLKVTRMIRGLNLPWDAKQLPGGRLLVTERESKHLLTWYHGKLRRVAFPAATVWASGETGLMSMAIAPGFGSTRRFYTCQGGNTSGGHEVKVMMWRLNAGATRATLVRRLLSGLPSSRGRHGGCRLLIANDGAMIVGTGDAAVGTNAHNISSLGGKTLRLNRISGAPWPDNTLINSSTPNQRYVFTFGHRNVQGLAQRADGTIWSVEHGPDRDDEVNLLQNGGDYGWNPGPGPYDESVPMTDQGLPGTQVDARWSSGFPTIATSGAAWVSGKQWGVFDGTLAVAALKGERVQFMRFDSAGQFVSMRTPPVLRKFGRLRSVSRLANGDLMVTTADGDGHDSVLRVHPGA
jgi:aldose sugar dehydrogenase